MTHLVRGIRSMRHALSGLCAAAAIGAAGPTLAQEIPLVACSAISGTYVTSISDIEGVFASRGVMTFTRDGNVLITDSGQGGLPGIYEPFTSGQGVWTCAGVLPGKIMVKATSLTFTLPPSGGTQAFGRVDYEVTLDAETRGISGIVDLSFPSAGDLEGADPIDNAGPSVARFEFDGRRLATR